MKILMMTMALGIGGAETHISELAKELSARGHDVTVASGGGVYESTLAENNVKHLYAPLNSKSPIAIYRSYKTLYRLLSENEKNGSAFDVVHTHARIPGFICGMLYQKMKHRFKFVSTAHGVYKITPLFLFLSNWGCRSLAVSCDVKQYLIDYYNVPSDNIEITVNGINTDLFSDVHSDESKTIRRTVEEELDLSPNCKHRIVHVSRLDKASSLAADNLIDAAEEITLKYSDLEILIVGDGTSMDDLRKKAKKINDKFNRKIIIFSGARTDINRILKCADIFVGVSRAALEAMSSYIPTILSGAQGYIGIMQKDRIEEAIKTNFCCRGCEISSSNKLYNDILSLFSSTEDYLGELCRYEHETVKNLYSITKMADDAEDLYDKCPVKKCNSKGDIIISGYYGFGNIGDETMLLQIISYLQKQYPSHNITILSNSPRETKNRYNVDAVYRYNFIKINRLLKKARRQDGVFVCGGGSLLQDQTSNRSFAYYASLTEKAQKLGLKTFFLSSGLGPINKDSNKIRAKMILEKADKIDLRDYKSVTVIENLGLKEDITNFSAYSFNFDLPDKNWISHIIQREKLECKNCFCISVKPYKDNKHLEQIVTAVKYIKRKYGLTPIVISMHRKEDHSVCKKIATECGGHFISDLSATEIIGIISYAKLLIGMRLHSLICSVIAGVTPLALSYDIKVDGLMNDLGFDYIIPAEKITAEQIICFSEKILSDRRDIQENVT